MMRSWWRWWGAEQMVFYYDAIFQALLQLVAPAVLHDDVVEVVALHGDVVGRGGAASAALRLKKGIPSIHEKLKATNNFFIHY